MTDRTVVLKCEDDLGARVDVWVAERMELSRSRVHRLLAEGRVRLDGVVPRKSEVVARGARLEVEIPAPRPVTAEAEDLPIDIVYQDDDLLVVDKAAGMVVHPARGHSRGTLVNALLHHVEDLSGIGGELRPGIVHRLDKDTSGLLMVAKSDRAHRALSDALRMRQVKRIYRAVAWGHLAESPLLIDAPIGRHPKDRLRMAVIEGGRRAISKVRLRESWLAAELLDVSLETGRTHQIRVHLAHRGHPVVGDSVYGAGWERGMSGDAQRWARDLARRVPRQFLHAGVLEFTHPLSGEPICLKAPLPGPLQEVAEWARGER